MRQLTCNFHFDWTREIEKRDISVLLHPNIETNYYTVNCADYEGITLS